MTSRHIVWQTSCCYQWWGSYFQLYASRYYLTNQWQDLILYDKRPVDTNNWGSYYQQYTSLYYLANLWQDLILGDKRSVVTNGWRSYYQPNTSIYNLANQWQAVILCDKRPVVTNGGGVTINHMPLDILNKSMTRPHLVWLTSCWYQ